VHTHSVGWKCFCGSSTASAVTLYSCVCLVVYLFTDCMQGVFPLCDLPPHTELNGVSDVVASTLTLSLSH